MRFRTIFAAFLLIVSSCIQLCAQDFKSNIDRGRELYKEKKFKEAKEMFEKAKDCSDRPGNWENICSSWIKACNDELRSQTPQSGRYTLKYRETYPNKGKEVVVSSNYQADIDSKLTELRRTRGNFQYEVNGVPGSIHNVKKIYIKSVDGKEGSHETEKPELPDTSANKIVIRQYDCDVNGNLTNKKVIADLGYSFKYLENDREKYQSQYYGDTEAVEKAARDYFLSESKDSVDCIVRWFYNGEQRGARQNANEFKNYSRAKASLKQAECHLKKGCLEKAFESLASADHDYLKQSVSRIKSAIAKSARDTVMQAVQCELDTSNIFLIDKGIAMSRLAEKIEGRENIERDDLLVKKGRLFERMYADFSQKISQVKTGKDFEDNLKKLKKLKDEYSGSSQFLKELLEKEKEITENIEKVINKILNPRNEREVNEAIAAYELAENYKLDISLEDDVRQAQESARNKPKPIEDN